MSNDVGSGRTLLSEEDGKKYAGQYVCIEDFNSKNVVASSHDPVESHRLAQNNGYSDPVLFYVPRADETFTFNHATH